MLDLSGIDGLFSAIKIYPRGNHCIGSEKEGLS